MTNKDDILDGTFKTFVESAPVLCLAADTNFITFYVNPFYKKVHNITLEQAKGKHIKDIIGEEGFSDNLKYYNQTLQGNVVEYHGSFTKIDGQTHHYNATYAPIYKNKEIVGITGVVLDITSEVAIVNSNNELQNLNKELEFAKSELTKQASRDPLTNLYNRRYFGEISANSFSLACRKKASLAIILLDIDHFKSINDNYGHDIGDQVLIRLADLLQSKVRKSDVVCRWGGEEFIILLHETSSQDAANIAEKTRSAVADCIVNISVEIQVQFTASFGVAAVNFETDKQLSDVINRADKALYRAKEQGRNKVLIEYS